MSIYALIEYVEDCKKEGIEPSWTGLRDWKTANWQE